MPPIIVEPEVRAAMRDGCELAAVVYHPAAEGRYPVLLARTPYGRAGMDAAFCLQAAAQGYLVVVQDTRGRGDSQGQHRPLVDEFDDGEDSVAWAAALPGANGQVGMWGGSYVGWTQFAAAVRQPPALRCLIPEVALSDPYHDLVYPGGALALGVCLSWMLGAGVGGAIGRQPLGDPARAELRATWAQHLDELARGELFYRLPLDELPLVSQPELAPLFNDWLGRPLRDAYWRTISALEQFARVQVPALHIGGWYDLYARQTLRDSQRIASQGATETARGGQQVLLGPWPHGGRNGLAGEAYFGAAASDGAVQLANLKLRWFDRWLKGKGQPATPEPAIRYFLMGANVWRTANVWPPPECRVQPLYLHSQGHANTLQGDGALGWATPAAEPADQFYYDPRDPVPTRGGGLCCSDAALSAGAFDQREVEARGDVLVYTSETLTHDLAVVGDLWLELWAASDAPDTLFTAKLVDVQPCGYARNLTDGVLRAARRNGLACDAPLMPGQPVLLKIDVGPTAHVFGAGHHLRLEVSSSNFPKYERHPNTREPARSEADFYVARQTVLHDAAHPSRLLLPLLAS